MLKKTITYNDLDGNSLTEDFYFNLNKAEIAEMEMSQDGGMGEHLTRIVEENDAKQIISTFKEILSSSYGERSPDGKRFIKSPELSLGFLQTEAYSELFMELVTNADLAAVFVRGIMPADIADKVAVPPAPLAPGERPPTQDHQTKQIETVNLPTEEEELEARLAKLRAIVTARVEAIKQ